MSQARSTHGYRHRIAIAIGIVALILLVAPRLSLDSLIPTLRTLAADQGVVGMVGFATAYAVAALLFVPGAALTLLAGGVFGLGWGVVVVAIATSVADVTSFLIGRYLARHRVERLTRRYPRFAAIDQAITQGGWRVVALLRLSPTIPYSASNYLYGLTGIPFVPYVLASGLFTLPGTFVYVYLGYLGAETLAGAERTAAEWGVLAVGLVASLTAIVYVAILARRALTPQIT